MTMTGVFKADHGNARFRWQSPCAMDSFCWLCRGIWIFLLRTFSSLPFHLSKSGLVGEAINKVWGAMSTWIGGRLDKRILPVNQVLYRAFDLIWQWQVFSKRTTAILVFVGRVPVRWIPFAGSAAEFEISITFNFEFNFDPSRSISDHSKLKKHKNGFIPL
jgi:hypothetical protein